MAYKVFTNGSVLQASEINDNLMRQSVMVFSNAAARTAAITTPLEGMLTWLEDTNVYQFYNGSDWANLLIPSGLNHINTTSFTAQTAVNIDDIFTSTYENYKLIIDLTAVGSAGQELYLRFRTAGVTYTSSNYQFGELRVGALSSSAFANSNNSTTGFTRLAHAATDLSSVDCNIYAPALVRKTSYTSNSSGALLATMAGAVSVTDAFDGINLTISTGPTFSGTIRVYGWSNS